MLLQGLVGQQGLGGRVIFGQLHFIVQVMNAVVTQPADVQSTVQGILVKVFTKESAPVQFFGNEVVESKQREAAATQALTRFNS